MSSRGPVDTDFARRVAHFDVIAESDRSDDDREDDAAGGVAAGKAASIEAIEREYLMGGGSTERYDNDDTAGAAAGPNNGCCARSCGGNEKASRVEGRNVVLGVTIVSLLLSGVLVYSAWNELNHPNRFVVCAIGMALGAWQAAISAIGLIGLCRFSDIEKLPFKVSYWLHLIQVWAYAAYVPLLLYLWDGKYDSGTQPFPSAATGGAVGDAAAAAGAVGEKAAAAFIEVASGAGVIGGALIEAASSAAPAVGPGSASAAMWFKMLGTQLWFLSLSGALLLLSMLYVYGSLRLRCKRMGKYGAGITAVLLIGLSLATLLVGSWTLWKNPPLLRWPDVMGVVGQMATSVMVVATAIFALYVSTRVSKLKLAAKGDFNTLLILTFVSALLTSACYFTYYQALTLTPRIATLHYTAIFGFAAQIMLLAFGTLLAAWRYALPDEYSAGGGVEKYGADEDEAFLPPSQHEI